MNIFNRLKKLVVCLCAAFAFNSANAGVVINEIMPCNVSSLLNEYYNYTGWLELYNSGEDAVCLKGYTFKNITGSKSKLKWEWTIEDSLVIKAGKYKIIFFDEEEGKSKTHAPYKIDSDAGSLILLDNKGEEVHKLVYKSQEADASFGLDGSSADYMLPTPGEKNGSGCSGFCAVPKFSGAKPGTYNSKSEVGTVTLSSMTFKSQIYYTIDGSEPNKEDSLNTFLYTGEIELNEDGNTVIRAKAYKEGLLPSKTVTGSFIFADEDFHERCGGFTVPVVSIVTDSVHFYSEKTGIYVKGGNGISGGSECVEEVANYNQDWKRPINFEFIENGEVKVSQSLEAAVMGGCSRGETREWKSLKITASKKQGAGGNVIMYNDFFSDKGDMDFKAVQVRNGGNDYDGIRIRDGIMQAILDGSGIDRQAYRPVAFYINGKYGGLFGLRERTNKDYVYSNYGYEDDEIDVIEITSKDGITASTGTVDYFKEMIKVAGEDQNAADYMQKMSKYMDIDEYVDYMTFEQFIVNTDWPGNNTKVWREKKHGIFRWIVYDTDFGLGLYNGGHPNYCDPNMNGIKFSTGESEQKTWANKEEWQSELFRNLLGNKEFQKKFITRNLLNLEKYYNYDRINRIIDSMVALASDEYCAMRSNEYYDATGKMEDSDEVAGMRSFAKKRCDVVPTHIKEYFKLGDMVDLSISSNVDGAMYMINGEFYDRSSFEGTYFADMELSVLPIPPKGYEFESWSLSASTSELLLSDSVSWAYYYDSVPPVSEWNSVGFDDSEWSRGKGRFGYASSGTFDTQLKYEDIENKPITAYFRTVFDVKDTAAYSLVKARIDYDDGYVIYINGKEIDRENMPEGDIDYSSLANEYVNDVSKTIEIPLNCLKNGVNEIAVEMHQNVKTSSDLVFGFSMTGVTNKDNRTASTFSAVLTESMEMKAKFVKVDCVKPTLVFNEICSSNDTVVDEYGFKPDWIEIVNNGDAPVNLAGLYLTDNGDKLRKSQISYKHYDESVIQPGEFKIIWADNAEYLGLLHAGFKISNEEVSTLYLSWENEDGELEIVDSVSYKYHEKNGSYGRIRDGEDWSVMYFDREQAESYVCKDSAYYTTFNQTNSAKEPEYLDGQLCSGYLALDEDNDVISVYPKLVDECVFISGLGDDEASCSVFNSMGALVGDIKFVRDGECVNVADLPSGTYILRVVSGNLVKNEKILKK